MSSRGEGREPLEVFYAPTPNGWKVTILLEELVECGRLRREDFRVVPVDLRKGEQFSAEFLAVSPNGRMPALRDGQRTLFESGAVLTYLAETCGAFMGEDKHATLQWLFWQVGGLGPMAGQVSHFVNYAPHLAPDADHSYSLTRYKREYARLLSVMERVITPDGFLAGPTYTIADMASFPWVIPYRRFGVADLGEFPNVKRWFDRIKARPAVRRGVDVLKVPFGNGKDTASKAKGVLFEKSKM